MAPTEIPSKKHTARGRTRLATWRITFTFCVISVLVLSLLPPSPELPTTGWDKSNHMLAFATLAFLSSQAWPERIAVSLVMLLAYGGLIEVLQSFTPDRQADFIDVVADGTGLLIGTIIAKLFAVYPKR